MIKQAIQLALNNNEVPPEISKLVMHGIFQGIYNEDDIILYLTALNTKTETASEIVSSLIGMRGHYDLLFPGENAIDIVGTGGDGLNAFNISTAAAIVASSVGVAVVKHGNHAATSKSGSADVVESLGININISPEKAPDLLKKCNFCFIYNQAYPKIMQRVSSIRKKLQFVTVFNKMRWVNPSGANAEMLGIYSSRLVEPMATALRESGIKRALVVCGKDGMDEITVCDKTIACEIKEGSLNYFEIDPREFGIPFYSVSEISGGSSKENALIIKSILSGDTKGAKRDIVLLNAAAMIYTTGKENSLKDAFESAKYSIDSHVAERHLEKIILENNLLSRTS